MSRHFIKNFGGEGTIVNISTIMIAPAYREVSAYTASKLAMMKVGELLQLGTLIKLEYEELNSTDLI